MGELTCNKRGCSHKIEYQHIREFQYWNLKFEKLDITLIN